MPEYKEQTDEVTKIELPSSIQQVLWSKPRIAVGGEVGLDVHTHYVGNGSDLEIEITDHGGKSIAKYKEKIAGNHIRVTILVPDNAETALYANVALPKHSLKHKSAPLRIIPPIKITNVKWESPSTDDQGKSVARRGDILKLSADIDKVPDSTETEIEIWEHDADEAHDLITKFPAIVENGKVEMEWDFEYHEDTDEIPTEEESEKGYNPPEYFFKVKVYGVESKSELLEFKDWIELELIGEDGIKISNIDYILYLPNGNKREGKLNEDGYAKENDVPPGKCKIEFTNIENYGYLFGE